MKIKKYYTNNKLFVCFLFTSFIIFLFIILTSRNTLTNFIWGGDGELYYRIYHNISDGKLPFIDFFFEYPPLVAFFISFPLSIFKGLSYESFKYLYPLVISIWLIIYFFISYKILDSLKIDKKRIILFLSLTLFLFVILFQLLLARYDIFPAILTTFSILLFIKYIHTDNKFILFLSILFITLGFSIKIYPIFILPIFIIIEIYIKKYKDIFLSFITFSFTCLLSLIFIFIGFSSFQTFFKYQTARDIQIESIYSSALLSLGQIQKLDNSITFQNGAVELADPLSHEIAKYPFLIITFFLIILYLILFLNLKFKSKDLENYEIAKIIILYSIAAISIFILFNKVLSPQYILWIIALMPLLSLIKFKNKNFYLVIFFLLLYICLFTILVYPILYNNLLKKDALTIVILNMRNLSLLLFFFFILYCIYENKRG